MKIENGRIQLTFEEASDFYMWLYCKENKIDFCDWLKQHDEALSITIRNKFIHQDKEHNR